MARIRCPKCSHVFAQDGPMPLCPKCGFAGQVASAAPAPRPAKAAPSAKKTIPAWVPVAIFVIVVALVIGLIVWQFNDDSTPNSFSSDASDDLPGFDGGDPDGAYTPPPEQNPAQFGELQDDSGEGQSSLPYSGSGNDRTTPFSTNGGVVRVRMNHVGEDDYYSLKFWSTEFADLEPSERGSPAGVLVAPVAGTYEATRYLGLPEGNYVVDVIGDGSWSFQIDFPDAQGATGLTEGIAGDGPDGPDPLALPAGDAKIHYSHEGDGVFRVKVWAWNGTEIVTPGCFVSDWPGAYERTKTCTIPATGPYFFDVEATGKWSIKSA